MKERLTSDNDPIPAEGEKMVVVGKAAALVPYEDGMQVDQLGSYVKHFRLQDGPGFVSIYIPGPRGTRIPGQIVSDSIWIVKRVPEELGNGMGITYITSYMIDEVDLSATRITDVGVFDTTTGRGIKPELTAEERIRIGIEEFESQASELTRADLNDVNALLDGLDPNDTFELPDPSNE